jgi:hypothetical protein
METCPLTAQAADQALLLLLEPFTQAHADNCGHLPGGRAAALNVYAEWCGLLSSWAGKAAQRGRAGSSSTDGQQGPTAIYR